MLEISQSATSTEVHEKLDGWQTLSYAWARSLTIAKIEVGIAGKYGTR
jgi:hypothetical protein